MARRVPRELPPDRAMRQVSMIVGGALVGIALLWFIWLFARQVNPGLSTLTFPGTGFLAQNPANTQADPLVAAGITLSAPDQGQKPLITRQQALLLANQREPGVAVRAGGVEAQYTLFSYKGANASQADFQNVPAWLIHYTRVGEPRPATSADPRASTTRHDFYIFLDAENGRELLAIWL